jgi:hypothetical protein
MPRPFRYPSHRILELINATKCVREGFAVRWEKIGESSAAAKILLDLVDGPFVDFVLHANAGKLDDPRTYRAALILDGERVRGVDFSQIERKRWYRTYIQKGWHENIIDLTLPTTSANQNRHMPLENFDPTDLDGFLRKTCRLWHIELPEEGGLL